MYQKLLHWHFDLHHLNSLRKFVAKKKREHSLINNVRWGKKS